MAVEIKNIPIECRAGVTTIQSPGRVDFKTTGDGTSESPTKYSLQGSDKVARYVREFLGQTTVDGDLVNAAVRFFGEVYVDKLLKSTFSVDRFSFN